MRTDAGARCLSTGAHPQPASSPRLGRHAMTSATPARDVSSKPHDALLTVAQAGEYLGTGERFVRRLIAERRIPYIKLGKYVRLQRAALDAFIDAGRVPSE